MNHLIAQFKEHMMADLEAAIENQEDEILEAIAKLRENRPEDDEKPLVFSASMAGKLNLDKSTVETAFSFAVKTTVKDKHTLDEPSQPKFAFN